VTALKAAAHRLVNLAGVLGIALGQWDARDDGGPVRRRAANEAMAIIDDMLAALHQVREQLADEMRAYDATAARVDKLLDEARARREEQE
jgi:hypothetical protein